VKDANGVAVAYVYYGATKTARIGNGELVAFTANWMNKIEGLAPSDKRVVQTLLWALKPLSNLRGSIPLPYAVTFLTVALEEGKPVSAYARELDLNRYVMTRYMQCIGDRGRNGKPGLGLVTIKQIHSFPVRTQVFLTDKGRAIAAQVFRGFSLSAAPVLAE
jgi:hypothetical protein